MVNIYSLTEKYSMLTDNANEIIMPRSNKHKYLLLYIYNI